MMETSIAGWVERIGVQVGLVASRSTTHPPAPRSFNNLGWTTKLSAIDLSGGSEELQRRPDAGP